MSLEINPSLNYELNRVMSLSQTTLNRDNVNRDTSRHSGKNQEDKDKDFKQVLTEKLDSFLLSDEGKKYLNEVKHLVPKEDDDMEKKKKVQCNHNPNDNDTTLEKLKKRNMVMPSTLWYTCSQCHKGFKFVKNVDGKLEAVE